MEWGFYDIRRNDLDSVRHACLRHETLRDWCHIRHICNRRSDMGAGFYHPDGYSTRSLRQRLTISDRMKVRSFLLVHVLL